MKKFRYKSRPFRVNEKNKEHWMTELRIAEPRFNPLIANVGQGPQNIELVTDQYNYFQAVDLGKERRYDLSSITVMFNFLEYKDQATPILAFTFLERMELKRIMPRIIMALELLRSLCVGNCDDKYKELKTYIDRYDLQPDVDAKGLSCQVPLGWLRRNIYKLHAYLTNSKKIITFIDDRQYDIKKMAASQPHKCPYIETRLLRSKRAAWALLPNDRSGPPFWLDRVAYIRGPGLAILIHDTYDGGVYSLKYSEVKIISILIMKLGYNDYRCITERLILKAINALEVNFEI